VKLSTVSQQAEKYKGRKPETLSEKEWDELFVLAIEVGKEMSPQAVLERINFLLGGSEHTPLRTIPDEFTTTLWRLVGRGVLHYPVQTQYVIKHLK